MGGKVLEMGGKVGGDGRLSFVDGRLRGWRLVAKFLRWVATLVEMGG
jgi:hypothetical protein